MNKSDVCLADTVEIADYADKVVHKMQSQELKKKTANLNTYQIPTNVSAAESVPDFAPVAFGKLNGVHKKYLLYNK